LGGGVVVGAVKINGQTSGSTTITAPASGGDETIELSSALAGKLPIAGGKILQIVRATDSTNRTTTSNAFVDASISVTITPQKNDSAIIVIWSATITAGNGDYVILAITDSSDNAISGAEFRYNGSSANGHWASFTTIGYSTPATIMATTYKGRFRSNTSGPTATIQNSSNTGQLFAIEVSA
jgi:hypothetical protein